MRSARVDFPWSMCAMMQKLRMNLGSVFDGSSLVVARGDNFYLWLKCFGCERNFNILAYQR